MNNAISNILIVDDTPANLQLLSSMLAGQGYKVRSAPNGRLALTCAKAIAPDLILLDITMPDMDGYEVCEQFKADPRLNSVPIIFISALDQTEDKVKAFQLGGVDYITKPFQIEEVLARVRTHLTLRCLQREVERANSVLEKRVEERTRELTQLNAAAQRFVPNEFMALLQKHSIADVRLGDQVQGEMTVMFSDIIGFTGLSEQMTPQENFNYLNMYLGYISPIIRGYQGFIDQYLGDGVMAIFPACPDDALQAAVTMQREVARYSAQLENSGLPALNIGIGLHVGKLMLGVIGEDQRWQGTVISDAVNLASRLEELTRLYNASIVVSQEFIDRLDDPRCYQTRFLDQVQVRGRKIPIMVYEIFDGDPDPLRTVKLHTKPEFEAGLAMYHANRFAEASVYFDQVLSHNPQDRPAQIYLQRSAQSLFNAIPSMSGAGE